MVKSISAPGIPLDVVRWRSHTRLAFTKCNCGIDCYDEDKLSMETVHITFELPRGVLSALRQDPEPFVQEMRLAAAVNGMR
jgi:hypothetical protein